MSTAFCGLASRTLIGAGMVSLLHSSASAHGINSPLEAVGLLLGNPDFVFVLLLVGVYGIILEILHPGTFLPGLIGVVCLSLAAVGLWTLPVQYGALALLLAGIALMTAEAFTPGFGVLGLIGFASFVAGGYYLFDAQAGQIEMRVSVPLIFGSAVASAGLILFAGGAALKARQRPAATGAEQMLTEHGTVIDWSGEHGNVRIRGEVWAARSARQLQPGDAVRVARRDGLVLVVEPV